MILCVSINPGLEVNIEVDSLGVGKVNRAISRRTYLKGKALNVAIGISRLGGDAMATGFMYEENGRMFEQELHREGVTYKFVWNEGRVREVYKFIDRRSMLTEVCDRESPVKDRQREELIAMVADLSSKCQAVVFSGESAEEVPLEYIERLVSAVPEGVLKVFDMRGDKMMGLLKYGVDLVKPNLKELQAALNIKISDRDSMIRACEALVEKGAKRVLLSLGKDGAIICDGKKRLHCVSINVPMNSRAGAGDAMVAAATKALAEGADAADILRRGVAAGTAAVTLPDSISFTREKYEEVLKIMTVKEI